MLLLLTCLVWAQDAPPDPVAPDPDTAAAETVVEPSAQQSLAGVFAEVERFQRVNVSMSAGVVHLTGDVNSAGAREEAARVAASMDGVLFVDNQLVVNESDVGDDSDTIDAQLQASLQGIFSQIDDLENVTVHVTSGVVQLGGTVVDEGASESATALAERFDETVFVTNNIEESTAVKERVTPAIEKAWGRLENWVSMLPLLVISGVVVTLAFFVGRWLAGWDALFGAMRDKPLMRAMVGRMVRLFVMIIGLVFAFEILGATALVGAVAGAAGVVGLAFGFAFQDIVENYLAGILLSVQQPFSQDDLIEVEGVHGVVVRLSMRNTLLLTQDGNHTYLPNAKVFKGTVVNYTRNPMRRFSFVIGVGTEEDLLQVLQVGELTLRDTEGVLSDPEPRIRIEELGDSTVLIRAYGWVEQKTHDFNSVRTEAVRRLKEAYDEAGFDMPEPIYRVRLHQEDPPAPKQPVRRARTEAAAVDLRPDHDLQEQVNKTRQVEDADLMGP